MNRCKIIFLLAIIVTLFGFTRCATVKPYQRMYVNDSEMKTGVHGGGKFEEQVQVYREGASGGGGRKGSGGCGCN
jgi:hypothetical protein